MLLSIASLRVSGQGFLKIFFINKNLDTILKLFIYIFVPFSCIRLYKLILQFNSAFRAQKQWRSQLKLNKIRFYLIFFLKDFCFTLNSQSDSQKCKYFELPNTTYDRSLSGYWLCLSFKSTYAWPLTPSSTTAHQPSYSPSGKRTGTQCAIIMGTWQRRFIARPVLHGSGQRAAWEELDGSFCVC